MSWIAQLVKTYDANAALAGKPAVDGSKAVLPPIGHIIQNAQIEITVDGEGNFVQARPLAKVEQPTLIPSTPDSASRTSSPAPHPLHDKLNYVARDYNLYHEKKTKKSGDEGKSPYSLYVELLGKWVQSPYSDPKVEAVYKYVTRHDVIDDLCKANPPVLYRDDKGNIMQKWPHDKDKPAIFTAVTGDLLKALVRFRVIDIPGDDKPDLWKDQQVQQRYIDFFEHEFPQAPDLCYAMGKMMRPVDKHAKGIRFAGDGAKLISSNDARDLTFRGRFETSNECVSIGDETSQKAMNTLMWLIRNQGYNCDGRIFLAWSSRPIPSVYSDTEEVIAEEDSFADQWENPPETTRPQTQEEWEMSFDKAIRGYSHVFKKDPTAQANVMVLDAATPGRLSICYYDEFSGVDFIDRIEKWHTYGRWAQHKYDEVNNASLCYYGVPTPELLVKACHGERVNKNKMKMEIERIFYCIVQGRPLPLDIERCVVRRVVTRSSQATGNKYYPWRQKILEPACTIICNRWNETHKEEVYTVALDETNRNRDYLFGRILAVADQIERSTFKGDERGSRITNAMKYMEVFSMRPSTTWMTIHNRLLPYMHKREQYREDRELLAQIMTLFKEDDFVSDAPLGSRFLLGFYSQQFAIQQLIEKKKKEKALRESNNADNNTNSQSDEKNREELS